MFFFFFPNRGAYNNPRDNLFFFANFCDKKMRFARIRKVHLIAMSLKDTIFFIQYYGEPSAGLFYFLISWSSFIFGPSNFLGMSNSLSVFLPLCRIYLVDSFRNAMQLYESDWRFDIINDMEIYFLFFFVFLHHIAAFFFVERAIGVFLFEYEKL